MDKVLVKLYVPMLEKQYDILIPSHKRIYNVINLLVKLVNDLNDGCYKTNEQYILYDRLTAVPYNINLSIKESNIRNGSEIVLV